MLRIEIIGNLGSDPEQRFTAEGVAQTSFRVAVNSRRRGPNGDQVERMDWFRVRVRTMGSKPDYVQRFTKGQRVLVVGRLEISDWETARGRETHLIRHLGRRRGEPIAARGWIPRLGGTSAQRDDFET